MHNLTCRTESCFTFVSGKQSPLHANLPLQAKGYFVTPVSDTGTALPTFTHLTIAPYPQKGFAYAASFATKLIEQFPQGSP